MHIVGFTVKKGADGKDEKERKFSVRTGLPNLEVITGIYSHISLYYLLIFFDTLNFVINLIGIRNFINTDNIFTSRFSPDRLCCSLYSLK